VQHPPDWTGAALLDILYYHMVPTRSSYK